MSWNPLRPFRGPIYDLRGRFKREYEVDVNLFSGDDHFPDQILRYSLTPLERQPFEIIAGQLAKCIGVINDLSPMNYLPARAGQLQQLRFDLLQFDRELLPAGLQFVEVDRFDLTGVEQASVLTLDPLSPLEQLRLLCIECRNVFLSGLGPCLVQLRNQLWLSQQPAERLPDGFIKTIGQHTS